MGFESFNAPPPPPSPEEDIPVSQLTEEEPSQEDVVSLELESATSAGEPESSQEASTEELSKSVLAETVVSEPSEQRIGQEVSSHHEEGNEVQERTRFVRQSLEDVARSIDRFLIDLRDRHERGLNELGAPRTAQGLWASSRALRDLSSDQRVGAERIGDALGSAYRSLDDFRTAPLSRGPLREDGESLRRMGTSIRLMQDSLMGLSSRLARHPDESFQALARQSARVKEATEDVMRVIARRHNAVDRYLGR